MNTSEKMETMKTQCKYGADCYQRNKEHLEKYKHDSKNPVNDEQPPTKKQCPTGSSLRQKKLNCFFVKKPKQYNPEKDENACSSTGDHLNSQDNSNPVISEKNSPVKWDLKENFVEDESKTDGSTIEKADKNEALKSLEKDFLSPEDNQKIIQKLFLVRMPNDFFSFWEFCKSLVPENPTEALKVLDLYLVGPFDVLSRSLDENTPSSTACRHWRYFYDPPEFQTVLRSSKSDLFHIGYYRDDPNDFPVFAGCNYASKNCNITAIGDNLFAAIEWCINKSLKSGTPFNQTKIRIMKNNLQDWAKSHNYSLSSYSESMKVRDKKTVAKTFHHGGIVVPFNKETEVGYRPLSENNTNLLKLLKKIDTSTSDEERKAHMSKLHEIVTWANIAMDEGDFGTTLELGIDLFCFGSKHLNSMILQLLSSSYSLLNRNAFFTILKAHLEDRKKGSDLSIINSNTKR